ncbi:MAG: PAS domain-containing protein, partial [Clostridium sp.]
METIFELLLEGFLFPVWIKGIDGKYIFANERYAAIYNKKREEIIGKTVEDLFEEPLISNFNSHCNEVIKSGKAISKDMYAVNGYRQCTIIPLKGEGGELIAIAGVIGFIDDYGKIKEKELEVEIQKNLTKRIMDILPGVIFYKDIEGKYVYANNECEEFYKARGVESILGKTDWEINPNKEQVNEFIKDDKRIIETRDTIVKEATFKNESGNYIYKEVVKVPLIDSLGNLNGIIGRSLDITEKKQTQARLEYLSYTDILTGAKNRACFELKQLEYSREEFLPFAIIMGDANGLKVINDTFGHSEGDRFLI